LDPDLLSGAIHWHHKIFPYTGPHRDIIEASCTPAVITYPTDLKLLNEARESTEWIIDSAQIFVNTDPDMAVAGHVPTSSVLPSRKDHDREDSRLR
jgi:hypothetical protein